MRPQPPVKDWEDVRWIPGPPVPGLTIVLQGSLWISLGLAHRWARLGLGTLSFLLIPSILGVHIKICWCLSKFNQLQYENWDHPMANSGIETTSTGLLQANSMYLSSTETWSAKLEMRERHTWDNDRILYNGIQHKPTKIKIIGQGYAYPTYIGRISQ